MPSALSLLHALQDGVAALRVHADGGLVEHDRTGAVQEPMAMLRRRFMPPEKVFGQIAGAVPESGPLQRLIDCLSGLPSAQSVEPAEGVEVLARRQVRIDGQFLRYEPTALGVRWRWCGSPSTTTSRRPVPGAR